MEYLDILDDYGNKIGIKSRDDVHKDGNWHKVACIFVVNNKGEIILQKRSKEKKSSPNKWTASASGHLLAGDTDIEGALRELEEEIGLKANENELQYLFTVKEESIKPDRKTRHFSNVYLLLKNVNLDNLTLQKEEVSEVKYVHYTDFEKMLINQPNDIVKHDKIFNGVLKELHKKFDN